MQNYPNPFNPSTLISFKLPEQTNVQLKIYDILGNEVATLANENKPAGSYEVEWNASNLPSGVYIYQLVAGTNTQMKKMLLLK
jgi:flagellar hook assembly protein FlgD